jgi:hypothetical protein
MAKAKTKEPRARAITGRVSSAAYTIFRREQKRYSVPTGKLLTAMILDFEEMGNWIELEEIFEEAREERQAARRLADRDRRRKERAGE